MAWPMPTAGQWNSGLAIAPDMTMANMGSYTAEQWAALQHQNWQQWAQWQQQYAQWQNQYGDKVSGLCCLFTTLYVYCSGAITFLNLILLVRLYTNLLMLN